MSLSASIDTILDAAEAIVCESSAAHMTLEAVAQRTRIIKGGLMYRFSSKEALLQAMIGGLIDSFEELREQVRLKSAPDEIPNELVVEIKMLSSLDETSSRRNAALLAVVANQPELMEQFHEQQRKRFSEKILSKEHPERSAILFLAAIIGLHYTALLNISILDKEQRMKTYADLACLASGDMEI